MKCKAIMVLIAAQVVCLSGCGLFDEPRAELTEGGPKLTEAQITAKVADAVAKAESQAKIVAAASADAIRKARADAELAEAQAKRSLDAAFRKVENAAAETRDELHEQYAQRVEAASRSLAESIEATKIRNDIAESERTLALASLKSDADAAIAEIERQYQSRSFIANALTSVAGDPMVQAGVGSLPGGGLLQGLLGMGLTGVAGWAARARGSKGRHDASYEEGKRDAKMEAEESRKREHDAWEEAQKAAKSDGLLAAVLAKKE